MEKLLKDYLIANNLAIYGDNLVIENIEESKIVNHIMFNEVPSEYNHPSYVERHEIPLIDIMVWLYSKTCSIQDVYVAPGPISIRDLEG